MSEEMQAAVFEIAREALSKYKVEKDVAVFMKEQFDSKYGTSWHCVVGRNFGSFVSHETNCFIYFYLKNVAIMLFKTAF
uniref:Dynein light chain n=2 Tax=Panagrolaimus TaxID=55784 RepID=A0A914QQA0_9BILA